MTASSFEFATPYFVALQTGMNPGQFFLLWYDAVVDLQVNNPQVFNSSDWTQYHNALIVKFTNIGFSPGAAQSIADYIASQIKNQ